MSAHNPWKAFQALVAGPPLAVGKVLSVSSAGTVIVRLPGGGLVTARGAATAGQAVFLRGAVIEGVAPDLAVVNVEI